MYQFLSVVYVVFIYLFMVVYIANFILNLVRALKVKKQMLKESNSVKGKVVDIIHEKKRVFVKVEYFSFINKTKFVDLFEFTKRDFADQYYVNQEVLIYYPFIENMKRITCFPTYLEGQKIKVQKGPLFTDILFAVVGVMMAGWITTVVINLSANGVWLFNQNTTDALTGCSQGGFNPIIYLLPVFMYLFSIPFIYERFTMADKEQNQNYLKFYGIKCMAEVKTFKFSRSKNQSGVKESLLEIEFYDNSGNLIKANLNSYMYTETQEQYITILYDIRKPKNVVYMRK